MAGKCKLAVLISGSGSNLQALIDAAVANSAPFRVVGVISDKPDAFGLQRAASAGIPATVVAANEHAGRDNYHDALAKAVDALQPDLVILAGFMRIIGGRLIDDYAGRMLNIHPALLPKYKGLHTHQRCLDSGDPVHGSTVHFVTAELDGGPPVVQAMLTVAADDDAESLARRVLALEHVIYPMAARWFAEGRLRLGNGHVELDGVAIDAPLVLSDETLVA